MLVVADASPFVGFVKVGHVDALGRLFGTVVIPPEVLADLFKPTQAEAVRTFAASPPAWLSIRAPSTVELIPDLDAGERAAICLAREIGADLLLIDETAGRAAAIACGIPTVRTAAVMKQAADAGHIADLADAFDRLRRTNFRVPAAALDALLAEHLRGRAKP